MGLQRNWSVKIRPANIANPIKLKRVDNSDPSLVFSDKAIFTSPAMACSKVRGHRFVFTYCTYFTVCRSMSTYMKCVYVTLDFG